MTKASIAIFRNQHPESNSLIVTPFVPDEVFQAIERVLVNKNIEKIKTTEGVYFIEYSETGPFNEPISDVWMNVKVTKLLQWSSGGVKKSEYESYKSAK